MKKILGIIVLGLLLSGNANSNEMRIECDNISSEKRISLKLSQVRAYYEKYRLN